MDTKPVIRLYRSSDRPVVRKICSDTADLGRAVENFFYDREIFADLVVSYYTDFEPACLWVADCEDRVVGYLSGCKNSRRYLRVMCSRIIPRILIPAFWRGVLLHKDTRRIFKAMFKNLQIGAFNRRDLFRLYPAHMHINLEECFRHRGLGTALVERFLEQLSRDHLAGVQVSVCQDNHLACNFFERLGFSVLGRYPMVRFHKTNGLKASHTVIYGRRL